MVTSYFTLRYIASTLNSTLSGTTIRGAFSQAPDELVFSLDPPSTPSLIVSCNAEIPICYLHSGYRRAKRNTIDVLRGAGGARITTVSILPSDRVIHLALSDQRTIALQFFGPKSNVLLISPSGRIEDAFRHPSAHRGEPYSPDSQELVFDFAALRSEAVKDSSALSRIRRVFPTLGLTLAGELLVRAGLDAQLPLPPADAPEWNRIPEALRTIMADLEKPVPRLYVSSSGAPAIVSIIPLRSAAAYDEQPCEDIHSAIRTFLSHHHSAWKLREERGPIITKLKQYLQRTQRSINAATTELSNSAAADLYTESGNLLLSNASSISRGSRRVELPGEREPVTILLDPGLSPVANAERYFERARRARASLDSLRHRIPRLVSRLAECERFILLLQAAPSLHEFRNIMKTHVEQAGAFGVGPKSAEREALPFRMFTVDGGFAVWAGKNSATNDLLTLRHARPDDLWFHARGSGGSHVVLRVRTGKGEPGRRAKEEAAAIAAYYSRMKTSGTVPVAMTLRKFVRKPKGSPPGTVIVEREKVLFVKAALPAPHGDEDEHRGTFRKGG